MYFTFQLGPLELLAETLILLPQLVQRGVLAAAARLRCELGVPVPQALFADTNGLGRRLECVSLLSNQADRISLEVIQVSLSTGRLRRLLRCNWHGLLAHGELL